MNKELIKKYGPGVLKALLCLFFLVLIYKATGSKKIVLVSMLEAGTIAVLCGHVIEKKPRLGQVLQAVLFFLYSIQLALLYFGNSYLSTFMLSNVESIQDLGGNTIPYLGGVLLVLAISLLPLPAIPRRTWWQQILLPGFLMAELLFTFFAGGGLSPAGGYADLSRDIKNMIDQKRALKAGGGLKSAFYKEGIPDGIKKPDSLSDTPDVVLILTEGLEEEALHDSRKILPNMEAFEASTLHFSNYFNHTFATYRGIIGQLTSGFQLENLDESYMISMQQILKDRGYHTTFLNSEPENEEFTAYLGRMGFDEVITAPAPHHGLDGSLTDGESYALLLETLQKCKADPQPDLIVIYTFGTHTSLNSSEEVYGDGSDPVKNKLYNADFQFGKFLEAFLADDVLHEDTLLVLTADHTAYRDKDYAATFPELERLPSVGRVPLAIYYDGVEPLEVNVYGRNTLDLAPTLLDILDVSAGNHFLGTSLFDTGRNFYDTFYTGDGYFYTTAMGETEPLDSEEYYAFYEKVVQYYAAKLEK